LFSTGIPLTLLGIERGRVSARAIAWARRRDVLGDDACGSRSHGTVHRRLLCRIPQVCRLRRLLDVLFRRRELQRDDATVEAARARLSVLPKTRRSHRLSHAFHRSATALPAATATSLVRSSVSTSPDWCDPSKRNWYGVDLQDTVRGAHKLGVAPREVEELIRTITSPA
jgi:hypothetical protein